MSSMIEGELQSLGIEGFEGWAWDVSKPYDPVEVEIVCNDLIVATALADGFSLDLVKQRKGNGMHMFYAKPVALPKAQYPMTIWARVRGCDSKLRGCLTVKTPTEFQQVLPDSLFQEFEGYVDGIRAGAIIGWARNAALPDEPVEVELLDGDRVLAKTMANQYRADVEQEISGGGQSGFELPLPQDVLDGEMHSLRVRVTETRYELHNSPISFGPGSANALIKEILRLRESVQAWEQRFATHSRDLMARFEALYSIQRDSFERELQAIKMAALGFPRIAESEPLLSVKSTARTEEPTILSAPDGMPGRTDTFLPREAVKTEALEQGDQPDGLSFACARELAEPVRFPPRRAPEAQTTASVQANSKPDIKPSRRKRG